MTEGGCAGVKVPGESPGPEIAANASTGICCEECSPRSSSGTEPGEGSRQERAESAEVSRAVHGGGWVGVFQGPLTGSVQRGDATLSITGVPSDEVGSAVAVAPGALFVGASGSGGDARNPGPGAVYRIPGVATGELSTTDMDLVLTGSVDGAGIGSSLAVAPAADGDALAVGAPRWPGGDDPAGAVWIITGLAD